jgi:CBS domain-containing protein
VVEFPDNKAIAGRKLAQCFVQIEPLSNAGADALIGDDAFAPRRIERIARQGACLVSGRSPRIADRFTGTFKSQRYSPEYRAFRETAMMRTIREIIRNQRVLTLPPDVSVRVAARAMAEHRVGSVMVLEHDKLVGIITERDCLDRVLAAGVDPDTTELSAVMTRKVMTITPDHLLVNALHQMHDNGFRHMPVVENGRPIGMISVRDALGSELIRFEVEEEIKERLTAIM